MNAGVFTVGVNLRRLLAFLQIMHSFASRIDEFGISFSNRELASLFWLCAFAVWVCCKSGEVRQGAMQVVKAAIAWKIVVAVLAGALYAGCLVSGAWVIGLIEKSDLFTVAKFVLLGVPLLCFRSDSLAKGEASLVSTAFDGFKIGLLVEFLLSAGQFSFLVELVVVAVVSVVLTLLAFSAQFDDAEKIQPFLNGLLSVVVLVVGLRGAFVIWKHWAELLGMESVFGVILSPLLVAAFSPFVYLLALLSLYESVSISLTFASNSSKTRAEWFYLLLRHCRMDLSRMILISRNRLLFENLTREEMSAGRRMKALRELS